MDGTWQAYNNKGSTTRPGGSSHVEPENRNSDHAHLKLRQSMEQEQKKIAHADLSHIKLTLARAAAFVSPEGNLAQPITEVQPKRVSNMWPPAYSNGASAADAQQSFTPLASTSAYPPCPSGMDSMKSNSSGDSEYGVGLQPQERALGSMGLERPSMGTLGMERNLSSTSNRIHNSCFVFYLPPSATDPLRQLFMRCGTVLNASVAMDHLSSPEAAQSERVRGWTSKSRPDTRQSRAWGRIQEAFDVHVRELGPLLGRQEELFQSQMLPEEAEEAGENVSRIILALGCLEDFVQQTREFLRQHI